MESPNNEPLPVQTLRWAGHTDTGRVRKNNEDCFLGIQFDAQEARLLGKHGDAPTDPADYAFAVSDGMGGALAGEFASKITVEKITRLLPRAFKQSAKGMNAGFEDVLTELFHQIHKSLTHLGESYEECAGMGATLTLGWFTPGWLYFAHIGDSRLYYLPQREAGIRQLSHDDSYVGWLFRNGKLNEREARTHPRKNVLQKALGAGHRYVDPQLGAVAYEPGDRFLLCTDGLTDGLFNQQLDDLLRTPSAAEAALDPARRLVAASLERSGRDNTTALVIEAL
jgi:protein phosphatase